MRVLIIRDENELAQWTAKYLIKRTNEFSTTKERPFVLGLLTGSSPIAIYNGLISLHIKGKICFKHVITFNMDKYIGIPVENINILNGNASNLQMECAAYENKILNAEGVNIFLRGIGEE